MNLSNLRNPLPNIRKAYSSNFSNTANESSDEKGAAELNEWVGALLRLLVKAAGTGVRGARGVGKVVAPLVAPDVVDVVTMDDTAHAPMLDPDDVQRWYDGDDDGDGGIKRGPDFGPDQAVPPTSTPRPPAPAGPHGVGHGMNP